MLLISHLSVEYLKVPISGPGTITTYPAEMALLPEGQDPTSGDWHPAIWLDGTNASLLIGPGTDVPLTRGVTYVPWVRLTASPEEPVMSEGRVHAT